MDIPVGKKKFVCSGLVGKVLRECKLKNGYLDVLWKPSSIVEYRGIVVLKNGKPILAEVLGVGVHLKGSEALSEILSHYCRKIEAYEIPKKYIDYVVDINEMYSVNSDGCEIEDSYEDYEEEFGSLLGNYRGVFSDFVTALKRGMVAFLQILGRSEKSDYEYIEDIKWRQAQMTDTRLARSLNVVKGIEHNSRQDQEDRFNKSSVHVNYNQETKDGECEECIPSDSRYNYNEGEVKNLEEFLSTLPESFSGTVIGEGEEFEAILVVENGKLVAGRVILCGEQYEGVSALYYLDYPCTVRVYAEKKDVPDEWRIERDGSVVNEIYARIDEIVLDRKGLDEFVGE